MDEYATFVPEQPFLFLRMKELEFLDSVKRKYTNVTGDTVEVLLREYLESRQLVLEERLPSGLVGVKKSHPCHFEEAFASRRFSRRTREDIFAVLPDPAQERIELDLLANHTVGFSVIGEVKYVTRYANAEEYYYEGSDDKDAERDRLLNLSKYLNEHPNRRQALGIPRRNVVVPVFITNAIGPLFADTDGVVKACPLEVLQVQPFFDLAIAQAEEIRQRSNVL